MDHPFRHLMNYFPWRGFLFWSFLFGLLTGCDTSLNPYTEPTRHFAIYGFLDTQQATQFLRINPMRQHLQDSTLAEPLTVTMTKEGDAPVRWRDTLMVLEDGSLDRVYYTRKPVEPGYTYHLLVSHPDGRQTRASTHVPGRLHITSSGLAGNATNVTLPLFLEDTSEYPYVFSLIYFMNQSLTPFKFPMPNAGFRTAGGISIDARLSLHRAEILRQLNRPLEDSTVVLRRLEIEIGLLSEEWNAPHDATNIDQGMGFFGSQTHYKTAWPLTSEELRRIGYAPR